MPEIVTSGQVTLIDLNDAKSLSSYIQSNRPTIQLYDPNTGALTPNWATTPVILTPELYVSGTSANIISQAKSITWYVAGNATPLTTGNGYTIGTTNPKALTINQNKLTDAIPQLTFIAEIVWTDPATGSDSAIKCEIVFARVSSGMAGASGQNAIVGILNNETHSVPTDAAGANGNFTGANSTMSIYNGATDDSANWTFAAAASASITGTLSGRTYTVTALSADSGYVDITASRSGYSPVTKRFTVTKNKTGNAGSSGSSPTAYWLVTSASAISKASNGAYTPATVTIDTKAQTGSVAPVAYAGRFIIAETTDGTTWVDKYTSAANEATKVHTPTTGIKAMRVRLYLAGGTTNLIDEEIIVVVTDGTNGTPGTPGANAVIAYVWTPNGNVVKNDAGSLTVKCEIYNGTTEVTTGITYQWQKLVNGTWVSLNSTTNYGTTGYNSATLTVPAGAIDSTSSFKCIATYGGKTYQDVATLVDQTDPIQAVLIAAEGTIFRNGEGTKNITAKLYQAGEEVDAAGTTYNYKWFMRNKDGVIDENFGGTGINFKTGKTIAVPATQVSSLGNLVLEVWTK